MIQLGRTLITAGMICVGLAVLLVVVPGSGHLLHNPDVFTAYKLLWAFTSPALLGGWILAVFHWGTRYVGPSHLKGRWGLTVIFGVFIGAFLYWWIGTHEKQVSSIDEGAVTAKVGY